MTQDNNQPKQPNEKGLAVKALLKDVTPKGVDPRVYYELVNTQIMGADKMGKPRPIEDMVYFLSVSKKLGLDPVLKQIYPVYRWDGRAGKERMIIQTGIDGFRLIAQRSKEYGGQDDVAFAVEEIFNPVTGETVKQLRATVTVYKYVDGQRMPVSASARWNEYAQKGKDKQGGEYYIGLWSTMPYNQLGKCLPARARLETDKGTFRIAQIVNKRMKVKVRSVNLQDLRVEWKDIVGWSRNGGTNHWIRIYVAANRKNGRSNRILVSPEHRILTPTGWQEAQDIRKDMDVYVSGARISPEQEQVVLGGLLGDGCIGGANTPHYSEAHSLKQEKYLLWKYESLSNLNPTIRKSTVKINGKDIGVIKLLTKSDVSLIRYRDMFYRAKKAVSSEILSKIDDLALAVWIMDDGNIAIDNRTLAKTPSLRLYTCGFKLEEQQLIATWFKEKYGVNPRICREAKNPYLYFNKPDTAKLAEEIKAYVLLKDGKKWVAKNINVERGQKGYRVNVVKVEEYKSKDKEGKYDIEVADNHNFLLNNIIVHNCAEAASLRKAFPQDLSGLYISEELDRDRGDIKGLDLPTPKAIEEKKKARTDKVAETSEQAVENLQEATQAAEKAVATPPTPKKAEPIIGVDMGHPSGSFSVEVEHTTQQKQTELLKNFEEGAA